MDTISVSKLQSDTRLDILISQECEDISRSRAKLLIESGLVLVCGEARTKAGFLVKEGDLVSVSVPEPEIISATPEDLPIDIIYEDKDIAVINKAQGMVTHPASGSPNGTLVNALMFHIKDLSTINGVVRPGIVHRLDKDTSGLIVIAKNDTAHINLSAQIANRTVTREYIAIVNGIIKEDSGKIEAPIGRSKHDRKKMAVISSGRYALTYYSVQERFSSRGKDSYSLVKFNLFTGRTHQIRVHSAHIHHPVAGDLVYGGNAKLKTTAQLLHASRLVFIHPVSGKEMAFSAEIPQNFAEILQDLNKYKI
ncbi:MAG: RluA family pseudouridine synthase [Firmicutes bacterium]|nr:RluA family pseudouridine synthase [Bacillota bacterium]